MNPRSIIRLYLALTALFTLAASMIWSINTLFLLGAGLNLFQVFFVNAVYTASMAVFEIPTGVFADTLGRKFSFLIGTFVLILGTLAYVLIGRLENNFGLFIFASAILGLAFTFYSGAVEAWLIDALKVSGHPGPYDPVFAKGNMTSSLSMLVGTITGGFLGNLDLSYPYLLRAGILLVVVVLIIGFMRDIGFKKRPLTLRAIPKEMRILASDSVAYGLKQSSVRKLMALSFLFSSFMMWGWYAWQPHFLALYGDSEAIWVAGLISASLSLSMALGSLLLKPIQTLFQRRTQLLAVVFALKAAMLLTIGFSRSFTLSVSAFVVFSICMGLAQPVRQGYLNAIIPSDKRATLISFDSLVGSSGSVLGQIGLGGLAQAFTIPMGYLFGGFLLASTQLPIGRLGRQDDPENILKKNQPSHQ